MNTTRNASQVQTLKSPCLFNGSEGGPQGAGRCRGREEAQRWRGRCREGEREREAQGGGRRVLPRSFLDGAVPLQPCGGELLRLITAATSTTILLHQNRAFCAFCHFDERRPAAGKLGTWPANNQNQNQTRSHAVLSVGPAACLSVSTFCRLLTAS